MGVVHRRFPGSTLPSSSPARFPHRFQKFYYNIGDAEQFLSRAPKNSNLNPNRERCGAAGADMHGKIVIEYYSQEDVERIYEVIVGRLEK